MNPYKIAVKMSKPDDLISHLFSGQSSPLATELYQWMGSSTRFTAFVETYRDKIRKKIRVTREPESLLDLRGELEVAYHLLNDRRLEVEYEPYANTQKRGPDFLVTYRRNLKFNVEVTRLRVEENEVAELNLPRKSERFMRILLSKLGQMQAGKANLLVIHTRNELAQAIQLDGLMQEIKTRAEKKEPSFYQMSGYVNPAAFYKDFLHLSGILLWAEGAQLWINKQARPGLDVKVMRVVSSLASQ